MTTLEELAEEGRIAWFLMMDNVKTGDIKTYGDGIMFWNNIWNNINNQIRDGKYDK